MVGAGEWAGAVHYSQLAVENYAKTLIALFEVPTWSHDPSTQLLRLLDRFPGSLRERVEELASMARDLAAEHGRSSYGEPALGLTPNEVYSEREARDALGKALRAKSIAEEALRALGVELQ